ncbi:hypothetical protein C7S13_7090 [Burkholderia cepacia]|nr:hypothetical protein [Burkholderia cepacia]
MRQAGGRRDAAGTADATRSRARRHVRAPDPRQNIVFPFAACSGTG